MGAVSAGAAFSPCAPVTAPFKHVHLPPAHPCPLGGMAGRVDDRCGEGRKRRQKNRSGGWRGLVKIRGLTLPLCFRRVLESGQEKEALFQAGNRDLFVPRALATRTKLFSCFSP